MYRIILDFALLHPGFSLNLYRFGLRSFKATLGEVSVMGSESGTAFVFAGGGSLGAVEVGMMKAVVRQGIQPEFVVGSSVGAINAAYYAGDPTPAGVDRLAEIWCGLKRSQVFPFSPGRLLKSLIAGHGYCVDPAPLADLLERHLPYRRLEEARITCHIVATDILTGLETRFSAGPAVPALLASTAIPGVFPPVRIDGRFLVDGGVSNYTPVSSAIALGGRRLIVFPTGYSCALEAPPDGVIASVLHGLNILVARQLVQEVERLAGTAKITVIPPLCPQPVSPYDFSRTAELIARAEATTEKWLAAGGLQSSVVPQELPPHAH